MPLDPIFSDSALLQGVKNDGCPKTATDISYTSSIGEPVVTNISDKKTCISEMFETNQFLENTNGCCVLESSEINCTDVANVDASEENNYYMGLRYNDESNSSEGERKICYTTPIRKKKLNIMDILGKITKDIAILITMVLVAACYEYWIVYGNCATNSIKTVLSDSPYSIDSDMQLRRKPKKSRIQDTCEQYNPPSSSTGLEWYDTFPYNLITALNNPEEKQDHSTRKNFSLAEVVKIPARSLLLGFFYCIIFSRICMKGLVEISKYLFSDIFTSDNSKIKRFIAGLVFIMIFMGLYGNIADKFVGGLPYMNASSLFLLFFIMTITIWIPSLLGLIMSLISFVGYRRDSYDKYKKRKTETNTDTKLFSEKTKEEQVADIGERLSKMWDWYFIVRRFFQFKSRLCPGDTEDFFDQDDDDPDENFYIKDEHILDWFFPIRRSKITIGWYNETVWHSLVNLFNFKNFNKCKDDDDEEPKNIGFGKKIYWYISSFYNNPVQLINPFFSLDVTCNEVNEACKSGWWLSTLLFAILWGFIFPQLRIYTWVGSIAFLLFLCFLVPFMNLLWIGFILIIAMYSLAFSLFGNMIALLYLHLYVIIGFFYVPFRDYSKLFKIIKSHGNILTILFCIIVVVASVNVLHPTSVGVIGGLLALIILYQLIIAMGI
jgi:hypothetical protein